MIDTNISIRNMTINDYQGAFALWAGTEGMCMRNIDDSYEGINKFLERNPKNSFVALYGQGELIGVILSGHDGRRGYVYHLAVHKDFRSIGIGKKLVQKVTDSLKELGITKASLLVLKTNESANTFWDSLGFYKRDDIIYRDKNLNDDNI